MEDSVLQILRERKAIALQKVKHRLRTMHPESYEGIPGIFYKYSPGLVAVLGDKGRNPGPGDASIVYYAMNTHTE